MEFETKDSGKREEYTSGMRRDIQEGKARPDLIPEEIKNIFDSLFEKRSWRHYDIFNLAWQIRTVVDQDDTDIIDELITGLIIYETAKNNPSPETIAALYLRLAELYGRGAQKYGENNWQKANGEVEYKRFKQSAHRHFLQYLAGKKDEDHFSATLFNLYGIKYTAKRRQK